MALIPFNDLTTHHAPFRRAFHEALDQLLDSSEFIGGKAVQNFERAFAEFSNCKYAVGLANGTDALVGALKALGVGIGDYVVTVSNTFIATAEAITLAGANIIFVDIDPEDLNMDMSQLEHILNTHPQKHLIKAVIPVHLHGQPADLPRLKTIVENRNIAIVADSAQAHGAYINNKPISSFADVSTFSFYPGKNLGALGDGGAITTNREEIAQYISSWRNHGRLEKYTHKMEGVNSRLDALQAAFLAIKLQKLGEKTSKRQKLAQLYLEALSGMDSILCPAYLPNRLSVFHIFAIRCPFRDSLAKALGKKRIQTGVHYPIPLHLQKAYAHLNLKIGSFPQTELACQDTLSLPLYPEMTEAQVHQVTEAIREFLSTL